LIVFREKSADRPTSLGQPALQLYRERVLILDIGFAVALSLFCLAFWRLVAQQAPSPFTTWLSIIGGTAGLLYGFTDVCEDVVLRALLERGRPISNFESTFASVVTRLKIIAICVSVVGAIVFVLMGYAFKAAFKRMRR
jgi:hypothetical protein